MTATVAEPLARLLDALAQDRWAVAEWPDAGEAEERK